jgi:hypothetical protein
VRIQIDDAPDGEALSAGMTATATVGQGPS